MKYGKFEIKKVPSVSNPFNYQLILHHTKQHSSSWNIDPHDLSDLYLLLIAHEGDILSAVKAHREFLVAEAKRDNT